MYKFSMGKKFRVRFVVYWLSGGKVHTRSLASCAEADQLKKRHSMSWMVRETVYSNGLKREAVEVKL